jgi:hypothetical protein
MGDADPKATSFDACLKIRVCEAQFPGSEERKAARLGGFSIRAATGLPAR